MSEKIAKKKSCFIITPIGDENTDIRRHADGIIDECILPLLKDKYNVDVSHRMADTGSITKQIINGINDADIVIANLTGLNPNVMYELAFRHATKKPAIVIAEKGTKIPFDISDERMILYTNDIQGAYELKDRLQKTIIETEQLSIDDVDNPIYNSLTSYKSEQTILQTVEGDDKGVFDYILNRLDSIEQKILSYSNESRSIIHRYILTIKGLNDAEQSDVIEDIRGYTRTLNIRKIIQSPDNGLDCILESKREINARIDMIAHNIHEKYNCAISWIKID